MFKKFFSKATKKDGSEDALKISGSIGPLIDKLADDIFKSYRELLVVKPISYIVPGVWGAQKKGEIDKIQKEINQQVIPVIDEIFNILQLKGLSLSQKHAIGFLIRGLIISKIVYIIAFFNNHVNTQIKLEDQKTELLNRIEPFGCA